MNCQNCNHPHTGGKFCGNCGAAIAMNATATTASGESVAPPPPLQDPQPAAQPNQHVEAAKNISKTYLNYFMTAIKNPFAVMHTVGREQFVNGIISIILYALTIPLMIYFSLGAGREFIPSPFLNIILKPTLAYAVFILLIGTFIFFAVKFGKVQANIQDVIARFGTILIPFVGIFLVAIILSVLKATLIAALFMAFGFLISIFSTPGLVIASFKKDSSSGLDTTYGMLLTYVLTFITVLIMSEMLFSNLIEIMDGMLGPFSPF